MDTELLTIHAASPEPIYRQIVAQISRMIASGKLRPGEPLPSVREVASHHAINPMTVSKAYALLEADGLLERQRGKGMVVTTTRKQPQSHDQRLAHLEPRLRDVARHAHELNLPNKLVIDRLRALLEQEE